MKRDDVIRMAREEEPVFVRQETNGTLMVYTAPDWMMHHIETVRDRDPLDMSEQITLKLIIKPIVRAAAETAPPQRQIKTSILWELSEDGYTVQNNDFENDVLLRISGDFERNEDRIKYAQWIVNLLNGK